MGFAEKMFSQIKAEGTNSFYIEGLFLYGAEWDEDEQSIVDPPKHVASIGKPLPMLHLMIEKQDGISTPSHEEVNEDGE